MDFLKELFGGRPLTFDELVQAINAHNGNEANTDKQIKIGNLGTGEYVGKGKYDALDELLTSKQTELDKANGLIAELKKGTKGNEELQGKINTYETVTIPELQKQLNDIKLKAALKVALLSEKALDIDYLTFKVNEKLKAEGKTLELDESEKIKGWDDMLSGLKTQFPTQFESTAGSGRKVLDGGKLPGSDNNGAGMTKAEFLRKPYNERAEFARTNPEAYASIMKN